MSVEVIVGDCREVLAGLAPDSVQTCVTSPPYFGLRDYGVAGQIGLEASVEEYVAQLVAVFREVRRVLRDDGTLWLNLGDSYNGAGKTGGATPMQSTNVGSYVGGTAMNAAGFKPKDMIGVPWRVAFALQADGWYLRSDIIWAKPNPMPESVRDRPTKAHEYIFLLAKSERYFYDAQAVMESNSAGTLERLKSGPVQPISAGAKNTARRDGGTTPYTTTTGRNRRTVWTVTTKPFKGAHFATFPPDLIEPCIKAGSSERGQCASCGAPWIRTTEELVSWRIGAVDNVQAYASGSGNRRARSTKGGMSKSEHKTTGWAASCDCNAAIVPQTVIDPFGGAGTTGLVANRLGRNAVLVELNPEYAAMARERIHADAPLFAEGAA